MNQLTTTPPNPKTSQSGKNVVSARELHQFLESNRQFADWIKQRIEKYELVENQDYFTFHKIVKNSQPAPNKGSGVFHKIVKNSEPASDKGSGVFDKVIKNSEGRPLKEYYLTLNAAKELCMVENNHKGREARKYYIFCEESMIKLSQQRSLPEDLEEAYLELARREKEKKLLNEQIKVLQPRSDYYLHMVDVNTTISMEQTAKLLRLPGKGRNNLYQTLRANKIIQKNSTIPYQQFINKGWFELKEEVVKRNNHPDMVVPVTRVTQKGLAHISKKLGIIITKQEELAF
jgi:anti-repressor protein